jgi:hypothetical protein
MLLHWSTNHKQFKLTFFLFLLNIISRLCNFFLYFFFLGKQNWESKTSSYSSSLPSAYESQNFLFLLPVHSKRLSQMCVLIVLPQKKIIYRCCSKSNSFLCISTSYSKKKRRRRRRLWLRLCGVVNKLTDWLYVWWLAECLCSLAQLLNVCALNY